MIIINLKDRTLFVNDFYAEMLACLLRYFILKRFYKNKRFNINSNDGISHKEKGQHLTSKDKKETDLRGGDIDLERLIEECMKKPGVYKVVRQKTIDIIRFTLQEDKKNTPIIVITMSTYILSRLLDKKTGFSTKFLGSHITITKPKRFALRTISSSVLGGLAAILVSTKVFLVMILPFILVMGVATIDCDKEVRYIAPNEQNRVYLDLLNKNTDKVFVKTSDEIDVYKGIGKVDEIITVEEMEKKPVLNRFSRKPITIVKKTVKSKRRFEKLSERTRTLVDRKRGDDTETREETQKILERTKKLRNNKINNH